MNMCNLHYLNLLEKLQILCHKFGGEIKFTDRFDRYYDKTSFYDSPSAYGVGVLLNKKQVICDKKRDVSIATIIHEMGHMFATSSSPNNSKEFEFFGWEYLVAQEIGMSVEQWLEENSDYIVTEGDSISVGNFLNSDVGHDQSIQDIIGEQIAEGIRLGIIKNGKPISILSPRIYKEDVFWFGY